MLGIPLKYVLWGGAGIYLLLGLILTRMVLKGTTYRMSFRDAVVGSIAMPVLFVVLMFFEVSEETWKRILLILAFDAPEIMRAKPLPTAGKDPENLF